MTPDSDADNCARTTEEAAFWLLTLQSEQLSAEQRAEFGDWLRRGPLNIAALLRVCQLQRQLTGFTGWQQIASAADGTLPANVLELPRLARAKKKPPPFRSRGPLALAAAAFAAVVVTALLLFASSRQAYSTQPGERRAVTLADGSLVSLAPSSRLVVTYRSEERLVTLQRGEAVFTVAKNPNRPFIVQTVGARVRALGTVFQVLHDEHGVVVTVIEGHVAVNAAPAARPSAKGQTTAPRAVDLVANQQVSVNVNGVVEPVRRVEGSDELAWATDQLRFENQTVADVARRFNRYNDVQIQLQDGGLADRRISGVLRLSDPESFVAFIQAAAGTRVTRLDATHIVLQSTESALEPSR